MNIWKRVSVFQIITALFVVVCIYVAWRWRTHVPPTIPEFIVPGLFVAVLGAVAVIITLRPQPMSKGEKIFWIVAATILCVCEISVLESAARGQLDQFNKIMDSFKTQTAILGDMNANTARLSERPVVVNPPAVTVKPPLQLQRENFGNLYDRILELSQNLLRLALEHQNSKFPPYQPYSKEWMQWNARSFKSYEKRVDDIVSECKGLHIEDTELNEYIRIAKVGLRPIPGVDDSIYMAMSAEDIRRIAERLTVLADDVKKAQP